jgi:3-hydroxyacyl-[acyl-carrier-protein] dehydratase
MKYLYDAEFIAQKLPQKYPFLLVDRILTYEPSQQIVCLKNVTQNEEFFVGHFPGRKIMPGVLICEALAQTSGLLGILEAERAAEHAQEHKSVDGKMAFLGAVNVKFLKPVVPGDQLILTARLGKLFQGLRAFEVKAMVDKEVVCEGVLKATGRE